MTPTIYVKTNLFEIKKKSFFPEIEYNGSEGDVT